MDRHCLLLQPGDTFAHCPITLVVQRLNNSMAVPGSVLVAPGMSEECQGCHYYVAAWFRLLSLSGA